ncbi:hypothetical protein [Bradyrhizobium japonicum]|uniref:hypothetical protein n=1 Tax=Bradyrhizobium japonicum TaxID=375 RepID=UPI0020105826|nr:hypothetical protein [Bradyrhizobium japonicum]UQE03296.1 hypothetical protein JEY30_48030 [Bradyrhizobium japonicum]
MRRRRSPAASPLQLDHAARGRCRGPSDGKVARVISSVWPRTAAFIALVAPMVALAMVTGSLA